MRRIDWPDLLRQEGVPFIERGANVKRGEINIRCPFCGSADPSFHMGLSLDTGWWSCWRNRSMHSGKSPLRLIMKLLEVPYWRARKIAGLGDEYVDPEGFDALAARLLQKGETARPEEVRREFLDHDKYAVPIGHMIKTRAARNYLYTRGFDEPDIDRLVALYDLRTARDGHYANRIIIPYYVDRKLVTWTARAIGPSEIRYKDLPRDLSLIPPKETLYNHDCLRHGGKVLVLVEGPFDALKLDFYGRRYGVRAVALSTNSIGEEQAFLLGDADDQFERKLVMMDNKTAAGVVDSMRLKQELSFLHGLATTGVPFDMGDAGELTSRQTREWCEALVAA